MPRHLPSRRSAALAAAALSLATVLTGCTGTTDGPVAAAPSNTTSAPSVADPGSATPSVPSMPVLLSANVADLATDIPVDTLVAVSAAGGSVVEVALSYQDPEAGPVQVPGELSPDASTWTARGLLEPATQYTLTMLGRGTDGTDATVRRSFTTHQLSKKQQVGASILYAGWTVGIALPVVVKFDAPIKDKAAIERRMSVTTVPAQEGGWAWYGNNEIHWRPKVYWRPGTQITVNADINGVNAGNGVYGRSSKTATITVADRSLTMKADLRAHQLYVSVNGAVIRTIPVSGGKPATPSRSGIKVISEKHAEIIMDGATIGIPRDDPDYYRVNVKWAMRETWSGEFLHAAPWSAANHGRANVSHGCIGMGTSNAGWLFNQVLVGDPVEVVGTSRQLERGNGWTDWNISYQEFVSFSALTAAAP